MIALALNKKEKLLISFLRQNARETLTNLSKKTSIPISTIYDSLKENNYITRNTCLLDFEKLGFHTRVNIFLKSSAKNRKELENYLVGHQNVNSVFRINNNFDFLIEGIFKQVKDVQEVIELLEKNFGDLKKDIFYITEELMKEEFLSSPDLVQTQKTSKMTGNPPANSGYVF